MVELSTGTATAIAAGGAAVCLLHLAVVVRRPGHGERARTVELAGPPGSTFTLRLPAGPAAGATAASRPTGPVP